MDFSRELHRLQCPKCKHGMEEVSYRGVVVDRCTQCKGLWFDGDEAQQLKRISGSEALDTGSRSIGRQFDRVEDINCPRCGDTMEKTWHWKQTHIWFEICRKHGIFLDAGEFSDFKSESLVDLFRGLIKGRR